MNHYNWRHSTIYTHIFPLFENQLISTIITLKIFHKIKYLLTLRFILTYSRLTSKTYHPLNIVAMNFSYDM